MAAVSYWLLSPSLIVALVGKLRGWERVIATPAFDWRKAVVDVVVPAKDEENTIAFALESLGRQDFTVRSITVVDDASRDRTSEVARNFGHASGLPIRVIRREVSIGKTPGLREICKSSDADVLFVLDADTVLVEPSYISRTVEELFRNGGVASVCGEVMPLTRQDRQTMLRSSERLRDLESRLNYIFKETFFERLLKWPTIIYRTALYLFLHRVLYDGHQKLLGNTLNPAGCAVAYRCTKLAECFDYAYSRTGDNMTTSEDIYIGHFFNWKGYRNVHIGTVRCRSTEPRISRLWRQMFLWSSSFIQSLHYFPELGFVPVAWTRALLRFVSRPKGEPWRERRRIREQYRAPWGEAHTRRYGRLVGVLEVAGVLEKISYPAFLIGLGIWYPEAALVTIAVEGMVSTMAVAVVADSGTRIRSAAMMVLATPVRLLSLSVDVLSFVVFLTDLVRGNRSWRK